MYYLHPRVWPNQLTTNVAQPQAPTTRHQAPIDACLHAGGNVPELVRVQPQAHRCNPTYAPVTSADQVHEEDIVVCQVQPVDCVNARLVNRKDWHHSREECVATNSNANGAGERLVQHAAIIRPVGSM